MRHRALGYSVDLDDATVTTFPADLTRISRISHARFIVSRGIAL
jgi:hypothetical protein